MAKTDTTTTEAVKTRKVSERIDGNVTLGEFAVVADGTNPFAREASRIAEDHPLVSAFRQSYENSGVVTVATPEPEKVVRVLRKIATQEGKGVRVKATESAVIFLARDAIKRPRKNKTA